MGTEMDGARGQPSSSVKVRFPVLESLRVLDYGLYPGAERNGEGLSIDFSSGLTVALGANGLGKTTLVWILYRMLSGPYDISSLDTKGDLGGRTLKPRQLRASSKKMFAQRVVDGAKESVAELSFQLGAKKIVIKRALRDLSLLRFAVDGEDIGGGEKGYQASIAELAGLWSFGDWVLALRYLAFYFEDRRELVWDKSAQRQVLRFLFLPPQTAQEWTEKEREILKLDSRVRNLSSALKQEERELLEVEELEGGAPGIREQVEALQEIQATDEERRDELDQELLALDAERQEARLALLRSEQERESAFRALEHAKLLALQERFPSASETSRYILAQLLSEDECLACGNHVSEVAEELDGRLTNGQCLICGSQMPIGRETGAAEPAMLSDQRVHRNKIGLQQAEDLIVTARSELEEAELGYSKTKADLQALDAGLARRSEKLDTLIRRLPPEEVALHERRDELALLRRRVERLRDDLNSLRADFTGFIEAVRVSIAEIAHQVTAHFEEFAKDFLVEDCFLSWSSYKERLGETGAQIEFPAFDLDMSSASFHSPVRRTGPEQVSESQREFIDLSFRMALMATADKEFGGTLVIDAPEASLDAVFVARAARVLGRFVDSKSSNRLIVTSNLTDGDLIPGLLRYCGKEWRGSLLNLFEVAEPTAAVRELADEYERVLSITFEGLEAT